MTIDEAIEIELYRTEANREKADSFHTDKNIYSKEEEAFRNREDYHSQIADWLRELKECREIMEFIDLNVRVIETNDGVMIRFGGGNVCDWARRKGERS